MKRIAVWFIALVFLTLGVNITANMEEGQPSLYHDHLWEAPEWYGEEPEQAYGEPNPAAEGQEPDMSETVEALDSWLDTGREYNNPTEEQLPVWEVRYLYFDGSRDQEFIDYVWDGDAVVEPSFIPVRAGYAFAFWYREGDKVENFEFGKAAGDHLELYAYFVRVAEETDVADEADEADIADEADVADEADEADEADVADVADEAGEADPSLELNSGFAVTISCDAGDHLQYGDVITLYADLQGVNGFDYVAEWMYNDGTGWKTIQTGTGLIYCFVLTEQNAGWTWMIAVTIGDNEVGLVG